jgi:predicted TIM-barrel fold metal-dependent hydrolase
MRIDAHSHGIHAERDAQGRFVPPLMAAWNKDKGAPEALAATLRAQGIERLLLLDPAPLCFEMQAMFGDFVVPIPLVDMDRATPEEIDRLLTQGGRGIKFIAPQRSYGDRRYFPLYDVLRARRAPAIFHTGYLVAGGLWDVGGLMGVSDHLDITNMRPAAIDRIARAFPDLKVLMAHFGNPWWEETWTVIKSHKNVYADFSGGTARTKSLAMWREMFAPNGVLHTGSVSKLCFACDGSPFFPGDNYGPIFDFYDRFYAAVGAPEELRRRIDRENILDLLGR